MYAEERGVPEIIAVYQDAFGKAKDYTLAHAKILAHEEPATDRKGIYLIIMKIKTK